MRQTKLTDYEEFRDLCLFLVRSRDDYLKKIEELRRNRSEVKQLCLRVVNMR